MGYGIVARLLRTAVEQARARGIPAGLLRPITLWPFPGKKIAALTEQAEVFLACELSTGQMVEDVRLAVNGRVPVKFYGRYGGMVPTAEELLQQIVRVWKEHSRSTSDVGRIDASVFEPEKEMQPDYEWEAAM